MFLTGASLCRKATKTLTPLNKSGCFFQKIRQTPPGRVHQSGVTHLTNPFRTAPAPGSRTSSRLPARRSSVTGSAAKCSRPTANTRPGIPKSIEGPPHPDLGSPRQGIKFKAKSSKRGDSGGYRKHKLIRSHFCFWETFEVATFRLLLGFFTVDRETVTAVGLDANGHLGPDG